MKRILSKIRKACNDYNMIEEGDLITVGVSGGKDSMLLLKALSMYSKFSPVHFDVQAIMVDLGLGMDITRIQQFCDELGVKFIIVHTQISRIVFDERHEKNPCALCAKMKRGALHNAMLESGSYKVALGHHADDFAETFLLGLLYEGRINGLKPVTFLDKKQITVIRPMIYLREKEIIYAVNKNNIPVVKSNCPADGYTKREEMKELIRSLDKKDRDMSKRLITAVYDYTDNYQKSEQQQQ